MKYLLTKVIKIYQVILSQFIGQHCRFTPSCSNYAVKAIEDHGSINGVLLAGKRLCRCHPWADGGIDEVPKANE